MIAMMMTNLDEPREAAPLAATPDTVPVERTRDPAGAGAMTSAKSKQVDVCGCCGKHKSSCECACCGKPRQGCKC